MSDPSDPIRYSVPARPAAERGKRLGKGLGALLGETRREEPLISTTSSSRPEEAGLIAETPQVSGLASLAVAAIEPLPGQPRRHFDEAALDELAASISARGVIQPVIVRPLANGRYQLVAGERRWRAAQRARLHEIPALVRELDDHDAMALALIENIQREDLNPVEEARAYHRLSEVEALTQAEIARLVDKSRSHVANLQRLLALPAEVLDLVEQGALSMGHARALIGHDRAVELARQVVAGKMSVRDTEALVKAANAPARDSRRSRTSRDPAKDADIAAVQGHLEEFLGLPVRIKTDTDPRSGTVTIRYRSLDQLDLICQRLTGGDI
ncbi:ParB/RepB/Spo0J family partition protein [Altererythrobacter sp. H2]|uniref:ParB/RepB/Spo0J family partition protein n=1 Tax=Altererythrobacter sp. H2 TaxID=3108391 RepID=UPI000BCC6968|nr:ParB/RepB/Spo0J family partition protein [Altererythrobacter sp. H2]OZA93853.1 MAG: chromosome partitioning protein ParB [Erythrobacter sp. 34-65-8]WRK96044.1 ParB/RepB/Spo0J family partition protein [Altererythrobacter sp. H2]